MILARPRPELFGPIHQVVHVFPTDQRAHRDRRRALCGFTAPATLLVPVGEISGMGCELCLAAMPADLLPGDATAASLPPAPPPNAAGNPYAIGLRGERVQHRIAANPVTTRFEGRDAVICACGVIGFLVRGEVPADYESCAECALESPSDRTFPSSG
ncbi:hypothetical protein [Saccharopolyspora flava]|uniref:Uncharacterized protein n=1 Tax=Saccharopolyspora flava TaxID=95161 RepID=A0A1I6V3Y9_9PSEU|nr:hypothetical protein [Saccharopolyspora flava]SFT08316.1 hypothetical protein SAMN05660874_05567 [Saccharopolyspora flava]